MLMMKEGLCISSLEQVNIKVDPFSVFGILSSCRKKKLIAVEQNVLLLTTLLSM